MEAADIEAVVAAEAGDVAAAEPVPAVLQQEAAVADTARRKSKFADLNPHWAEDGAGVICYVHFDCPEGHDGCKHTIPFTPALDGSTQHVGRVSWQRKGDTFETLTLNPSIKRHPTHKNREEALKAGCLPQYIGEWMFCRFHGFVVQGKITFCGDSG